MADELTINGLATFIKGALSESFAFGGQTVDVTGTNCLKNIQTVGTTEEALYLGDISSGGFLFMLNIDATNYISFRAGTGVTNTAKLLPGEPAFFRLEASAPFVIANTATCKLQYLLIPA